jgi:hypothetical protein
MAVSLSPKVRIVKPTLRRGNGTSVHGDETPFTVPARERDDPEIGVDAFPHSERQVHEIPPMSANRDASARDVTHEELLFHLGLLVRLGI